MTVLLVLGKWRVCVCVCAFVFVQVDSRLVSLSEQYDGPQPSDVCNLLEGEQFFAGFEKGIDITSGTCTHTLHIHTKVQLLNQSVTLLSLYW